MSHSKDFKTLLQEVKSTKGWAAGGGLKPAASVDGSPLLASLFCLILQNQGGLLNEK